MKFLLRSLIVLAVAAACGAILYYAVQALPGATSNQSPGVRLRPEGDRNEPDRTSPRLERRENERGGGSRFLLGIARRILLFSVLVVVSVFAKNLLFERRLIKTRPPD